MFNASNTSGLSIPEMQNRNIDHSSYVCECYLGVNDSSGMNSNLCPASSPTNLPFWFWPILLIIFVPAVVGNIIVIHAIIFVRRFCKPKNFMVANLCVNSAIFIFSAVLLRVLQRWPIIPYNNCVCGILAVVLSIVLPVEAFTIMCISRERANMIRRPLDRTTREGALRNVGAIWIFSIILTIPGGFLTAFYDESRQHFLKCSWGNKLLGSPMAFAISQAIFTIVTQLLPSVIVFKDFCRLAGHFKFLLRQQASIELRNYFYTWQRLIRNALICALYFLIPRIPIAVYISLYRLSPDILPLHVYCGIKSWKWSVESVAAIHISLYPLLVFFLSTEIRSHVLCCIRGKRNRATIFNLNDLRKKSALRGNSYCIQTSVV